MAGPAVGAVEDGYRFKGGNPADQTSWEKVGPKAAPAWGPGALEFPDGSIGRIGPKGGMSILRKAPSGRGGDDPVALTEDQGKAQTYSRLMQNAERSYEGAVKDGYDPGSLRNSTASFFEGLPLGGLDGIGTAIRDDKSDRARQAELQWSDAQLKAVSGAAAPEEEVKRGVKTFFPRPGESNNLISPQKRAARAIAFEAAKMRSGPAGPAVGNYPRNDIPETARATSERLFKSGRIDPKAPFGSEKNPFVAKNADVLNNLPPGSYVITPEGHLGVID